MRLEGAASDGSPIAFVSSFTREFGDLEEDGSPRKDGVRFKALVIGEELARPVSVPTYSVQIEPYYENGDIVRRRGIDFAT